MRSVLFATQGRKRILLDLVLFLMCVCVSNQIKPYLTISDYHIAALKSFLTLYRSILLEVFYSFRDFHVS